MLFSVAFISDSIILFRCPKHFDEKREWVWPVSRSWDVNCGTKFSFLFEINLKLQIEYVVQSLLQEVGAQFLIEVWFFNIFSLEVVFWLHAGIALSKSIYLWFHASYFSFIFPLRMFYFCPFCRVFFCFVFVYLGPVALWFEYNGLESLRYGLVLQDPLFSLYFSHFGTFCILYFILAISNNLSEQT